MQPSAMLCRTQGALQLARAESATLANVKQLARAAAAAWFREAIDAEGRERRRETVKARSAESAVVASHVALDEGMSENPDLGRPDASRFV